MAITRTQISADVTAKVTSKTEDGSFTNIEDGANRELILDYIDQETSKTSGSASITGTPSVLPYGINSCNFTGGVAYLPNPSKIGEQIYVIATANNIEIRANVENTAKMFATYGTFVSNVILTTNQMYRFIFIGFGTGPGSLIEGFWKAEQI